MVQDRGSLPGGMNPGMMNPESACPPHFRAAPEPRSVNPSCGPMLFAVARLTFCVLSLCTARSDEDGAGDDGEDVS